MLYDVFFPVRWTDGAAAPPGEFVESSITMGYVQMMMRGMRVLLPLLWLAYY